MAQKLNYFIRTITKNDILESNSVLLCKRGSQAIPPAIRIYMGVFDYLSHRKFRFRRRPQRIFVTGKLYDLIRLQAQLTCCLLDRLPRLIRDQIANPLIPIIQNTHSRKIADFLFTASPIENKPS